MAGKKPTDEKVIAVCSQETDMTSACVRLDVSRSWLTNRLAMIEMLGEYRRRSNCPILIRDA